MDGETRVTLKDSDGETLFTGTAGDMKKAADHLDGKAAAQARVRSFIQRIESLEGEKKDLADNIKEVYEEAQGEGYSPKAIKEIVRIRKMDRADRQELAALVGVYAEALADFGETPLGAFLQSGRV